MKKLLVLGLKVPGAVFLELMMCLGVESIVLS